MTPFLHYPRISSALGVELWVKHDDLYPMVGGGNKARKFGYIIKRARTEGSNSLVSAGAAGSNHARVVALGAARMGWRCKLVIHDQPRFDQPNLRLMRLAGAELIFTDLASVARVMDEAMDELRREGLNPFYIWGGGHLLEGGLAYYEAYQEMIRQVNQPLDYIVCASGTGTTQAGLHVGGLLDNTNNARVLGLSVARSKLRGTEVVIDCVNELLSHLRQPVEPGRVEFFDDWTQGGYGERSQEVVSTIEWAARMEGLVLDPVYTGKAFTGLCGLIRRGEIEPGSRVVFWHTGGLLNLAADMTIGNQ